MNREALVDILIPKIMTMVLAFLIVALFFRVYLPFWESILIVISVVGLYGVYRNWSSQYNVVHYWGYLVISYALLSVLWTAFPRFEFDHFEYWFSIFSKFFFVFFIFYYLTLLNLSKNQYGFFFIVLTIIVGSVSLVYWVVAGYPERLGDQLTTQMDYGLYSVTLFLILGSLGTWALKQKRLAQVIWFVSIILSLLMTLLSGTRSAWLILPFALLFWSVFYMKELNMSFSRVVMFLVAVVVIGSIVTMVSYEKVVEPRVERAIEDIHQYQKGNAMTSIGLRFLMWENAIDLMEEAKFMGIGTGQYKYAILERYNSGLIGEQNHLITNYSHVHNQYFMELVERGVLGLILCLLVIFYPSVVFLKRLFSSEEYNSGFAVAGLLVSFAFVFYMLADTPFIFTYTMVFYMVFMLMLFQASSIRKGDGND